MDDETFSVINNLNSDSGTDALAAKQGKVLNGKIEDLRTLIENTATDADIDAIFTDTASI